MAQAPIRPSPGSLRKKRVPTPGVEPDGSGPSQPSDERSPHVVRGGKRGGTAALARASSPCRQHHEPRTRSTTDVPVGVPARLPHRPRAPVVPRHGARGPRRLGGRRHVRRLRRGASGRRERQQRVRLLRRPAVRQRPAPLRPPAHRLRQGRRAALPDDARQARRAPLRLGHPRPARRGRGRAPARHQGQVRDRGDGRRGLQRGLPHLRAALHRRVARVRHPPGPLGRLRQRLQDARPGLHGKRHVGLQDPVGQGSGLPGLPRALVLLALRHPAVGHRDQDGRRLPGPAGPGRHGRPAPAAAVTSDETLARRSTPATSSTGRSRSSGPPPRGRCRRTSRWPSTPTSSTCWSAPSPASATSSRRPGVGALRARARRGARGAAHAEGHRAARPVLQPAVRLLRRLGERPPDPRRRLRHHRGRHRHRAHRARVR